MGKGGGERLKALLSQRFSAEVKRADCRGPMAVDEGKCLPRQSRMCVCQVRGVFLGAPPFECAYSGQMKSAADVTHPSKVPDKGFPCHMPCRSFKVPEHYVAVKAYVVRNCTENAAAAAAPVG